MIRTIVTRFPNLEVGMFAGLLFYFERIRRDLRVTRGQLGWKFISTSLLNYQPQEGEATFNVGGGKWDQHGHQSNVEIGQVCSLNLVQQDHDFLANRKWLAELFELVCANDVWGKRISGHPFNLRELMTAMTVRHADNPLLVLHWLALAFCGIFENLKSGGKLREVFDPPMLLASVKELEPELLEQFQEVLGEPVVDNFAELCRQARNTIQTQGQIASEAIDRALDLGRTAKVWVESIGAAVRVIEVISDSVKTGPVARSRGYQVIIQHNGSGHCQIHGGGIRQGGQRQQVDFGRLVNALRLQEAEARGRRLNISFDRTASGPMVYSDGTLGEWYFHECRTFIGNGTLSSKDGVEPTRLSRQRIFNIVVRALPNCEAVIQEDTGARRRESVVPASSRMEFLEGAWG